MVGDVVFGDHQAVPIRGPPGGEDLVADHGTVQVGFDNTERRDAEGRAAGRCSRRNSRRRYAAGSFSVPVAAVGVMNRPVEFGDM